MRQMTVDEKRKKFASLVRIFSRFGFEEFQILEVDEAIERFGLDAKRAKESPACYYPQHSIAVVNLDLIQEDINQTTHLEWCMSHELAHYLVDSYLRENETEVSKNFKAKYSEAGFPSILLPYVDTSFWGLYGQLTDVWECLTNSLAFQILGLLELFKSNMVLAEWIDEEFAPALEEYRSRMSDDEVEIAKSWPNMIKRTIDDFIMIPLQKQVWDRMWDAAEGGNSST